MKTILILLAAMLVVGCASFGGHVQSRVIAGEVFIEHIDTNDAPPPCGISHQHGCYQKIGGVNNVWYSEVSPYWVPAHEVFFHGRGGEHGEYQRVGIGNEWCAQITRGAAGYKQGDWLCNDGKKEYVREATT